MNTPRATTVRTAMFVVLVMVLVCLPFAVFGEDFVEPLLESRARQTGWLTALAVGLLACDAVAPVPSTLVIMFLAAKAGWLAGIVGGTLGLGLGVLGAAWLGRAALGRVAPRFIPAAEFARLRASLDRQLVVTLACLRSVPILAETSVILAAASGVSVFRIFTVTLLPNVIIATIYAVAADDSFVTAAITFLATLGASLLVWQFLRKRNVPESELCDSAR